MPFLLKGPIPVSPLRHATRAAKPGKLGFNYPVCSEELKPEVVYFEEMTTSRSTGSPARLWLACWLGPNM